MKYLKTITKALAITFNVGLLVAAGVEIVRMFLSLYELNTRLAIQNGLFIVILLEMVYVIDSFIKKKIINIGLIINVGIVAIIKEIIFRLDTIDIKHAMAFGVLMVSLSIGLFVELYFNKNKRKIS